MVALTLGAVSGIANLPGCVLGGYVCDRFPRRTVYVLASLACALGEAAMAWGPHTPGWFAVFVILNAAMQGFGWAAIAAVCFEQLGARAAATVGAVLTSLSNLPVVVMVAVVGAVQPKFGSSGMLLTEAACAVGAMVLYMAVATIWRPARAEALQPAAA
jgi:MFS transporter, PAT family, beta-lactamase induction signal transducer AmpG